MEGLPGRAGFPPPPDLNHQGVLSLANRQGLTVSGHSPPQEQSGAEALHSGIRVERNPFSQLTDSTAATGAGAGALKVLNPLPGQLGKESQSVMVFN